MSEQIDNQSNPEIEKIEKPKKKSRYIKKGNNGGARPGAGRKKKEVRVPTLKATLKEYLKEGEVEKLIAYAVKTAYIEPTILKFLLEQVFGKAPQQVRVADNEGGPLFADDVSKLSDDKLYELVQEGQREQAKREKRAGEGGKKGTGEEGTGETTPS